MQVLKLQIFKSFRRSILETERIDLLINEDNAASDYIAILANEDRVNIIGLTRGKDTIIIPKSLTKAKCM